MTELQIQKDKCKKIMIAGAIVAACALIILIIGAALTVDALRAIGIFGILGAIISVWVGYDRLEKVKRSYCPACGKKFDYENDVSWEETEENEKTNSSSSSTTATLEATVEVQCHCANCGNSIEFTKKFIIAKMDKDGKVTRKNLRTEVRKYFIE